MPRDSHRNHISTDTPPLPNLSLQLLQYTYPGGWKGWRIERRKRNFSMDGDFLKEKHGGEKGLKKKS
jgi:hypothetical protein